MNNVIPLPAKPDLGWTEALYFLPFDHRGSFQEKLFGIKGRSPTVEETRVISDYKRIIFEGFKRAVDQGAPRARAGILVDEQFGAELLHEAREAGFIVACPVEKSGQNEFDCEYGTEFGAHIEEFQPTFVKVLVRYNPEDDEEMNHRQALRLKHVSAYCHARKRKFMFELLVPPTKQQLDTCEGDPTIYDCELRPPLMVQAMAELQLAGVEPDVWKLEGIESELDCRKVVEQARIGGRKDVGVIVLGRGESTAKVKQWLTTAAHVDGVIGFAVGRTVFWDALKGVRNGSLTREQAVDLIATNYRMLCDLWTTATRSTSSDSRPTARSAR